MRLKKYAVAYDSFAFELLNERMMFEKLCFFIGVNSNFSTKTRGWVPPKKFDPKTT